MVNFVPISSGAHAGKAWRRPLGFAFASGQAVVPLMGAEFAKAAPCLPIGFIEQAGLHVPVAVMSGATDLEQRAAAMGAVAMLPKPLNVDVLIDVVRRYCA